MNIKPILVVYYSIEGLSKDFIIKNITEISKKIEDYHVFCLPTKNESTIEVFYDKDIDEKSFEELKEKILKDIKNL